MIKMICPHKIDVGKGGKTYQDIVKIGKPGLGLLVNRPSFQVALKTLDAHI
jgi:hypothetical protein